MNIFETRFYDIPLLNWFIALGVFAFTLIAQQVVKSVLIQRLSRVSKRARTDLDDFVVNLIQLVRGYFILALSLFLGVSVLGPPAGVRELVRLITVTALLLQVAVWGQALISFLINRRMRARLETDPAAATTLNAFNLIARIVLWVVILLLVLDNLPGIQITSLIASLGITGVAVALAVQNILGDLFASLSIAMDKPFVIGDSITVDKYQGTVEYIGLKSTRLRSLEGEQLIFSNSDLLSSRIRNYKRMTRRRVQFHLRVRHGTPPERLAAIPGLVQEIIHSQQQVTFDRAHLKEIGESAMLYEVVYFMETPDYDIFMDTQQAINLEMARRFAENSISFAFPTHSVVLEHSNGRSREESLL